MATRSKITKIVSIVLALMLSFSFFKSVSFAKSEDTDWGKFASDYYYRQMNEPQKRLYEGLYKICMEYLTTTKDVKNGFTDFVKYDDSLDWSQVIDIATIFENANPQFYFLEGSFTGFYDVDGDHCITLYVYNDFKNGVEREKSTKQFLATANEYIDIINKETTDYDKERMAHKLIAERMSYNEDAKYDQTSASVFLGTESVCAGYSEGLELLLNAVGIECIPVSSVGHEWVQVNLDGIWYGVDVTWDDTNNIYSESFFNVSDETLREDNDSHEPRERFVRFNRPVCEYDYIPEEKEEIREEIKEEIDYRVAPLYRLYNPITGEHFYTMNIEEQRLYMSNGWNAEGIGGLFPAHAGMNNISYYRFRNPNTGEHHYASDDAEIEMIIKAGWIIEGFAFYSLTEGGTPIYRLYNPNAVTGTHFYTIDEAERDYLVSIGWRYEGIAWHASEYDGDGFTVSNI